MNKTETIDALLNANNGVVTTAAVLGENISKTYFMEYVKKNGLRRIAHGIYAADDMWPDEYQLIQLQYPKVIFSHESALYLNGLAEREPDPISVTVPGGYHSISMEKSDIRVYRVSADNHETGLTYAETPTGATVRCYDLERTLCDLLRSKTTVDYQELISAFKSYVQRSDKNIPKLMRYGKKFRVAAKLKPYMEVLL